MERTNKEVIKKFWDEFDAYTLKRFQTFKQEYGKFVESALLRTCVDMYEKHPSIECGCNDCVAVSELQAQ